MHHVCVRFISKFSNKKLHAETEKLKAAIKLGFLHYEQLAENRVTVI